MTKVGLYWDEWYTWFISKDTVDEPWLEASIAVPNELVSEYYEALNKWHDARQAIRSYVEGQGVQIWKAQ